MKTKLLFLPLFLLAAIALPRDIDPKDNHLAYVDEYRGLLIFQHSKPVQEYEYLGSVSVGIVWSKSLDTRMNTVTNKAKDKYPNADAIIFTGDYEADCIKFKE